MKLTGSGHAGKEGSAFFIWGTVKQWNSLLAENVEKVSVGLLGFRSARTIIPIEQVWGK